MNKFALSIFVSTLFIAGGAYAATKTVNIDATKSSLKWTGEKVTGSHHGLVHIKSGTAQLNGDTIVGGEFAIDMPSIKVVDIEDPNYNKKLKDHLNSDDFFSTDKFPESKFVITKSEKIATAKDGEPNVTIHGDLTIKGITVPLSFPATVTIKDGVATATAKATVDRTKYNVRYGSGKFFQNLGDKLIYDEFKIDLNLVGAVQG